MARAIAQPVHSGNLNSSLRGQSMADLQRQYGEGLAYIANNAATYAQQARAAIEAARSNLVAQNASLADPGQVVRWPKHRPAPWGRRSRSRHWVR